MESALPERQSQQALAVGTDSMTSPETDKIATELQPHGLRPRLRTLLGVLLVVELIGLVSLGAWWLCLLGHKSPLIGGLLAVSAVGLGWLCWRFFKAAYRRRFQFSLRTLLILVAVIALGLGLLVKPLREHRRTQAAFRAFELVRRLGAQVTGSYPPDGNSAEDGAAHIRISGVPLDGVNLEDLQGYPNLEELSLTNTSVSEDMVTRLRVLKGLRCLGLDGSTFDDTVLLSLGSLPHLTALSLRNTSITDERLEHLADLTNLRTLVLSGTPVTDAGMRYLKTLPNLSVLYLMDTRVTDAGLEHLKELKSLRYLFLGGTRVTDAGLPHLKDLRGLRMLSLEGTGFSDEAVSKLTDALPECKVYR